MYYIGNVKPQKQYKSPPTAPPSLFIINYSLLTVSVVFVVFRVQIQFYFFKLFQKFVLRLPFGQVEKFVVVVL